MKLKIRTHFQYLPILLGLICSTFSIQLYAQKKRVDLEAQRMEIIKKIEETDQLLSKNRSSQVSNLEKYQLLNDKIRNRERLVSTIQEELILVEASLNDVNLETRQLSNEQSELKNRYQYVLNALYKRTLGQNKWLYILDGESINDAFLRWQYIGQYEEYIQDLYREMESQEELLTISQEELKSVVQSRSALLATEQDQMSLLLSELTEVDELLGSLKEQQTELVAELNKQKQEREKLNQAIEEIIFSSFNASVEEKPNESEKLNSTIASFEQRKGQLPWPVSSGRIQTSFGRHEHPTVSGVYIENNGIDIICEVDSEIRAIHGGTVVGVNEIRGFGNLIIIQHDQYYSVYSKLSSSKVDVGDAVEENQVIGIALTSDGIGSLHFEIWKNKTKVDPEKWINKL